MKYTEEIFGYIMIVFVVGVILKIYLESDSFNLRCVISNVDGNEYCVRERNKIQLVADLLAKVTNKLKQLVEYMGGKYPERDNVKRMVKNFNPQKITETLPTSSFTAYSENKGEKMAFCVTKKKNGTKLIDENTLTFVAIHELAHIATESIGHKDEFWNNFKFLLTNAKKIGIYNPVDYKKQPKEYCGMKITDNPYYDL
jgi:hypothetical protein